MRKQNVNTDCYVVAPDNTAKYAVLSKDYGNTASLVVLNMSDKEVFVKACKNQTEADAAAFPASATVPVAGQPVAANGGSVAMDLPPGTTHVVAMHGASGGTGNCYMNVDFHGGS